MKTCFNSPLAEALADFVSWKRAQGLEYKVGERRLSSFDRFLNEQKIESLVLTRELLGAYQAALTPLGETQRYTRFLVARDFARYYQQIAPASEVVETMPFKKPRSDKPFIFSRDDIIALMGAARQLKPTHTIRPHVIATLIGLLYTTGMRIAEALRLRVEDFQEAPYRLFIAKSKFGKDRWLVLRDSTARALKAYFEVRRCFSRQVAHGPLFLNQRGNALSYASVQPCFQRLLDQCGIGLDCSGARPKLHSLRHSFAVSCLVRWYREGLNPNDQLPYLVTYLGHVDLTSTQIYLRTTPELRSLAAQRFHDYVFAKRLPRGGDHG